MHTGTGSLRIPNTIQCKMKLETFPVGEIHVARIGSFTRSAATPEEAKRELRDWLRRALKVAEAATPTQPRILDGDYA